MVDLSEFVTRRLRGGVWHTTSVDRFESIRTDEVILVEPKMSELERYAGSFVRSLGGVSVFDFPEGFDLEAYERELPAHSLGEFIPYKRQWTRSVWLRIDVIAAAQKLLSGKSVRAHWKETNSTKRFIAEVEGAHIGDIPLCHVSAAYSIGEGDLDWHTIDF